jgi:DEAD/DEAH box helicase domain-containing protein
LPAWAQDVAEPHALSCSRDGVEPALYCRWPQAFARGTAPELKTPGVLVLDDVEPADEATRHTHWRRWLHLYNTLQTLSGVLLATRQGLQCGDYELIMSVGTRGTGTPHTDAASQVWASVLNGVLPEVRAGMQRLLEADVPPPDEVGYEHANERGEVDAEAEVAWLAAHVVVLTGAQMECASIWQVQGWTTVLAQEGWEVEVQAKINLAGAHP